MRVTPTLPKGSAQERELSALEGIAEVWRSGDAGQKQANALLAALNKMASQIEEVGNERKASEYHGDVAQAICTVEKVLDVDGDLPSWAEWRIVRAVASGALPLPSKVEQAATMPQGGAFSALRTPGNPSQCPPLRFPGH
eukprot:3932209-Prymnesium_polylepis.1